MDLADQVAELQRKQAEGKLTPAEAAKLQQSRELLMAIQNPSGTGSFSVSSSSGLATGRAAPPPVPNGGARKAGYKPSATIAKSVPTQGAGFGSQTGGDEFTANPMLAMLGLQGMAKIQKSAVPEKKTANPSGLAQSLKTESVTDPDFDPLNDPSIAPSRSRSSAVARPANLPPSAASAAAQFNASPSSLNSPAPSFGNPANSSNNGRAPNPNGGARPIHPHSHKFSMMQATAKAKPPPQTAAQKLAAFFPKTFGKLFGNRKKVPEAVKGANPADYVTVYPEDGSAPFRGAPEDNITMSPLQSADWLKRSQGANFGGPVGLGAQPKLSVFEQQQQPGIGALPSFAAKEREEKQAAGSLGASSPIRLTTVKPVGGFADQRKRTQSGQSARCSAGCGKMIPLQYLAGHETRCRERLERKKDSGQLTAALQQQKDKMIDEIERQKQMKLMKIKDSVANFSIAEIEAAKNIRLRSESISVRSQIAHQKVLAAQQAVEWAERQAKAELEELERRFKLAESAEFYDGMESYFEETEESEEARRKAREELRKELFSERDERERQIRQRQELAAKAAKERLEAEKKREADERKRLKDEALALEREYASIQSKLTGKSIQFNETEVLEQLQPLEKKKHAWGSTNGTGGTDEVGSDIEAGSAGSDDDSESGTGSTRSKSAPFKEYKEEPEPEFPTFEEVQPFLHLIANAGENEDALPEIEDDDPDYLAGRALAQKLEEEANDRLRFIPGAKPGRRRPIPLSVANTPMFEFDTTPAEQKKFKPGKFNPGKFQFDLSVARNQKRNSLLIVKAPPVPEEMKPKPEDDPNHPDNPRNRSRSRESLFGFLGPNAPRDSVLGINRGSVAVDDRNRNDSYAFNGRSNVDRGSIDSRFSVVNRSSIAPSISEMNFGRRVRSNTQSMDTSDLVAVTDTAWDAPPPSGPPPGMDSGVIGPPSGPPPVAAITGAVAGGTSTADPNSTIPENATIASLADPNSALHVSAPPGAPPHIPAVLFPRLVDSETLRKPKLIKKKGKGSKGKGKGKREQTEGRRGSDSDGSIVGSDGEDEKGGPEGQGEGQPMDQQMAMDSNAGMDVAPPSGLPPLQGELYVVNKNKRADLVQRAGNKELQFPFRPSDIEKRVEEADEFKGVFRSKFSKLNKKEEKVKPSALPQLPDLLQLEDELQLKKLPKIIQKQKLEEKQKKAAMRAMAMQIQMQGYTTLAAPIPVTELIDEDLTIVNDEEEAAYETNASNQGFGLGVLDPTLQQQGLGVINPFAAVFVPAKPDEPAPGHMPKMDFVPDLPAEPAPKLFMQVVDENTQGQIGIAPPVVEDPQEAVALQQLQVVNQQAELELQQMKFALMQLQEETAKFNAGLIDEFGNPIDDTSAYNSVADYYQDDSTGSTTMGMGAGTMPYPSQTNGGSSYYRSDEAKNPAMATYNNAPMTGYGTNSGTGSGMGMPQGVPQGAYGSNSYQGDTNYYGEGSQPMPQMGMTMNQGQGYGTGTGGGMGMGMGEVDTGGYYPPDNHPPPVYQTHAGNMAGYENSQFHQNPDAAYNMPPQAPSMGYGYGQGDGSGYQDNGGYGDQSAYYGQGENAGESGYGQQEGYAANPGAYGSYSGNTGGYGTGGGMEGGMGMGMGMAHPDKPLPNPSAGYWSNNSVQNSYPPSSLPVSPTFDAKYGEEPERFSVNSGFQGGNPYGTGGGYNGGQIPQAPPMMGMGMGAPQAPPMVPAAPPINLNTSYGSQGHGY